MKTEKQTIEATANNRDKTFTIRRKENGRTYSKYRTIPMSTDEFESAKYWTQNDWKQFLKTDEYFIVK